MERDLDIKTELDKPELLNVVDSTPAKALPGVDDYSVPALSKSTERWYLASFFWIMLVCGWGDGTT